MAELPTLAPIPTLTLPLTRCCAPHGSATNPNPNPNPNPNQVLRSAWQRNTRTSSISARELAISGRELASALGMPRRDRPLECSIGTPTLLPTLLLPTRVGLALDSRQHRQQPKLQAVEAHAVGGHLQHGQGTTTPLTAWTRSLLLAPHSLLPTHSSLLTPYSSLLTPYSLLLSLYSLLLTPHSFLLTPHSLLLTSST